jgi:hypothetical protein
MPATALDLSMASKADKLDNYAEKSDFFSSQRRRKACSRHMLFTPAETVST